MFFSFNFIVICITTSAAIICALLAFLHKTPVHSLICIISSIIFSSFMLIAAGADTIGFFGIIIYIGAILVLFLFVVMMTELNTHITWRSAARLYSFNSLFFTAFVIFSVMALYSVRLFYNDIFVVNYCDNASLLYTGIFHNDDLIEATAINQYPHVSMLAETSLSAITVGLYSYHMVTTVFVGFLLFLSVVISIELTLYHRKTIKRQEVFKQHNTSARVRVYR